MGNCCKKTNAAVITPELAAGSVASPYYVQAKITKKLCKKVCVNEVPVFAPVFSVVSVAAVGTGQYVAFNLMYSDLCRKFDDGQILDAAWLFYFADEDWPNGGSTKVWDYVCAKHGVKRKA